MSANYLPEVLETTEAERLATGFTFTEGPLWHPEGFYYFVDLRANKLYRIVPGGQPQLVRHRAGQPQAPQQPGREVGGHERIGPRLERLACRVGDDGSGRCAVVSGDGSGGGACPRCRAQCRVDALRRVLERRHRDRQIQLRTAQQ